MIEVGEARPYEGANELMELPNADTSKPVYPLTGAWSWFDCRLPQYANDAALNCARSEVPKAQGACWITTNGLWRCNMTGSTASATQGHPPPK